MAHALANTAMAAKIATAASSSFSSRHQQCGAAQVTSAWVPRKTRAQQRRAFKAYAVDAQGGEPMPAPSADAQINMYNAATIKASANQFAYCTPSSRAFFEGVSNFPACSAPARRDAFWVVAH